MPMAFVLLFAAISAAVPSGPGSRALAPRSAAIVDGGAGSIGDAGGAPRMPSGARSLRISLRRSAEDAAPAATATMVATAR
jgi:hypothetical protein